MPARKKAFLASLVIWEEKLLLRLFYKISSLGNLFTIF